jgi:Pvc16 N-terminal domain
LKDHLNASLNAQSGWTPADPSEDKVVFVDGEVADPMSFKLGAVSLLLVNLEEEKMLRAADPYRRVADDGSSRRIRPDLGLSLYVLFVARFKQYEQSLAHLSRVVTHFQVHRVLDQQSAPGLGERIESLVVELVTLPLSAQNELWGALRAPYHPSALYKVKMVVYRDDDGVRPHEVRDKAVKVDQVTP